MLQGEHALLFGLRGRGLEKNVGAVEARTEGRKAGTRRRKKRHFDTAERMEKGGDKIWSRGRVEFQEMRNIAGVSIPE